MDNEKKWFGRQGVGALLSLQNNSKVGVSSVTRTMAAAYKQFDDITMLLYLLTTYKVKLNEADAETVAKIVKRHDKYETEQ